MGNNFTTTPASPPAGYGGMTLTEARATVTQFARNAAGAAAVYSAAQIDRAIRFVGNHFVRETGCLKAVSTTDLTAGDAVLGLASLATAGFRPERLIAAYVSGRAEPLDLIPWEDLRRRQVACASAGAPRRLAFADWTTANVEPTPDADCTLTLRWREPFTTWTAGTATPDDVTLNIPADWLAEILPYGPPAVLQHNETEQLYASASWAKYLQIVDSLRGAGGLGAQTSEAVNPWRRACRGDE